MSSVSIANTGDDASNPIQCPENLEEQDTTLQASSVPENIEPVPRSSVAARAAAFNKQADEQKKTKG